MATKEKGTVGVTISAPLIDHTDEHLRSIQETVRTPGK